LEEGWGIRVNQGACSHQEKRIKGETQGEKKERDVGGEIQDGGRSRRSPRENKVEPKRKSPSERKE